MRSLLRASLISTAIVVVSLAVFSVLAQAPLVERGTIRSCPGTPNCVSSVSAHADERVPPLAAAGNAIPWTKVRAVVIDGGGKIEAEQPGYLWATFTSSIFRFVDDVEIVRDADGTLQVRSAARAGAYDFGVNRKRVNKLRERLEEAP